MSERTGQKCIMPTEHIDEVYFAVNMRLDGPVPGLCSTHVLELNMVGAGRDGQVVKLPSHVRDRFAVEMRPLGRLPELTRNTWLSQEASRLAAEGTPVGEAIVAASAWVRNRSVNATAVPITWPGGAEGIHLHHYFTWRGDGSNPFAGSAFMNNAELVGLLLSDDSVMIAGDRAQRDASAAVEIGSSPVAARSGALSILGSLANFR
jgi:hypothetical protein